MSAMQTKDKQYLVNIFDKIESSVKTVNEKIIAQQQKRATVEDLIATVALEQLTIQHEILMVLGIMFFDPGTGPATLPVAPRRIMGFMGK
jgi:hypothetical protein